MLYPTELRAPVVDIAAAAPPEQPARPRLSLAGLLLAIAGVLGVAEAAEVVRVSPVPVVRLDDGRAAVLAGVVVPAESSGAVAGALAAWIAAGPVEPGKLPGGKDRHGRVRAARARAGETAQVGLVTAGLALADPEGAV